MVETAT